MKCLQDCLCCIRCGLWCNVMTSSNYNINGEQHDLSYWSYGTAHWHRTMSNIRLYFMIELIDFYWLITDQSSLMRHHKHRAISPYNIYLASLLPWLCVVYQSGHSTTPVSVLLEQLGWQPAGGRQLLHLFLLCSPTRPVAPAWSRYQQPSQSIAAGHT